MFMGFVKNMRGQGVMRLWWAQPCSVDMWWTWGILAVPEWGGNAASLSPPCGGA